MRALIASLGCVGLLASIVIGAAGAAVPLVAVAAGLRYLGVI